MSAELFMALYGIGFSLIIPVWVAVGFWREYRLQRCINASIDEKIRRAALNTDAD